MTVDEARQLIAQHAEEEPVTISVNVLSELNAADLPEGVDVEIGTLKENVVHLEWEGRLYRKGTYIYGEAEYSWPRKYWSQPLGMAEYLDLVRRAVETRHRLRDDVEITEYDDEDETWIHFAYAIRTTEANLGRAFSVIRGVKHELEEAANQAVNEVGQRIAEVAARLSGWGDDALELLVERVSTATSADDKGRSLEELCSRLFASVSGFKVTGRVRTATEEIDISIINDSSEPRLRRESALVLAECKNWSGKCGKDEFVVFREKMENRNQRCSLGFLISWNGFTGTITKEMLRGSRENLLIVPVTGENLRAAIRANNFPDALLTWWDHAVTL